MNISCSVIEDLLSLYADGLTSQDTNALVESHLENCTHCQAILKELRTPTPVPALDDARGLKRIRSDLHKKKGQLILLCVLITLCAALLLFGIGVTPEYQPFEQDLAHITQSEDTLYIALNAPVTGYLLQGGYSEETQGQVYHLSAYSTLIDRLLLKKAPPVAAIALQEQNVSLYYYPGDQYGDVLLYGEGYSGGIQTLPRLTLNYYALFAGILLLPLGIVLLILCFACKSSTPKRIARDLFLLPLCYLCAHVLLLAFTGSVMLSYMPGRAFCLIVLLAMALYGTLQLLFKLLAARRA